jgi:hypothetical protein
MSLNCRIFRDEKGQIDFVNAPNGNRSKLFDNLVNITGGNKNTALNIYALTEVEELKEGMNTKLNALKERFKSIVKVAPADISFSIIGLKGAQNLDAISGDTVIVENLEVAIEMENSNETPLKIKIATGWQRGADNQWKYELDSSKASLNLNIDSMAKLGKKYSLKSILKYPELFKAYPELNDVKISVSKKGGTTTEGFFDGSQIVLGIESNKLKDFFEAKARLEKYKNLNPEVLRIVRKNIEIDAYRESLRASGVPFSEAFDMAFEKYPYDERQADLEILGRLGYAEMTKSSVSNLMFLAEKDNFYQIVKDFKEGSEETLQKSDFNNLNDVLLPVTLHEIQHWIQQKEGFARGASTRSIYSYFTKEQIDEYKSLVEKKKEEEAKLNGKKWYDAPPEIRDIIFAPTSYIYQRYRSAMGEEEARNVEKRLKMTPKERLYSMLQDTEDMARGNQIFIPQINQGVTTPGGLPKLKPKISNELQANQKEVIQDVTDRLKQSGLAKNVYQMSNSEIETRLEELGEENVEKTAAGFTYKGDVYLNTDAMGLDTPIHEFGHLHLDWLKENRNDLYKAGLSLIEKNKEEAQQYIDTVKETQPDLKEGTEKFNNEVLAQVIGDQGAKLIQSKEEQSIADWLRSVWESIKDVLGLTSYTADEVSNMTLADFGTASATEMLSGNRISRNIGENNAYLRYKYDVNQVARERFDIPNLKEISSGSDRVVFDLGDNKVLKVANTARGLAQNMQEGDAQLIEKGLIPQVYETGLNYVVVEKLGKINEDTRIPVYDVKGKRYDDESLFTMIKELSEYSQADFDVKDQNLIDILNSYGIGAMADYDIIFGDLLNPSNWGMKDGKLIHLDAGTFGGMYMIRAYARRKDMSFEDFKQVYEKSQEAKEKFGDVEINANINFSIVAGNKLFNEPLEEAGEIADEYIKEKGLSTAPIQKITKLDTENSKRIAKEFDKMKATPNDPQTKAAYNAMVEETLEQYEKIISKGYKVEINNSEPYDSSADMIKDLRENKSMKIFSTDSGFGDEPITYKQRKENPLLQETKYKDVNGLPLLANDVFRFVHDFFGHAKFGNGFGAIGEENAWNIHARMYSPLARRAMTTETRGQNSFVNFSGVNDEVFKKRDRARVLRQQGKLEEAKKLTEEVYEEMSFAEQKVGLLPEEISEPYPQEESLFNEGISNPVKREPSLEKDGVKIFAKERVNPITGEIMGAIEWELIESTERGKGNARKAAELFLNGTDAQGKDVYLTISPRDNETSPEKLESFYSSLGFQKTSDFEMVRKAKSISLKDLDSNGEPSISTLMGFSNSKVKPLGLEGLKAAKNAAMALKVKSSQELIEKMEKALMKNGIVLFDKLSLQRSKLYNTFEINTILSSPKLQKQIKDSILALRNSEPFAIEYDEKFIVPQGREVNQFGKQEVINPNVSENEIMQSVAGLKESEIDESLPAAFTNKYYTDSDFRETVDSIARDYKKAPVKTVVEGELVDKVEDVENMLLNTVTNDENDSMSEDIMFLREEIDEEIFNSNLEKVSKVLNKIKKNAYINGIDLRNLPTLALELSREELLGFLDSMEDVIVDQDSQGDLKEFSERYFEVLGDKEAKTEIIKSDSENDIIVEEPLSEYEMFSKFGLVKKDDNIYRQVTEESLDNLYENFFEYKNLLPEDIETVEALKSYVQKNANQLEVSDYEVDVDNLEKMFLYKKFFDFPMSTQKARVKTDNFNKITNSEGYLTDIFMKEFNKWILATANPYFKVTGKGIELINNDELSKVEAINSVPEKFKQELAEYNIISDSLNLDMPLPEEKYEDINTQLEQRQKAVNNPDRVKKVSGQYTYLKDEVLAAKNESETFVRTPIGIFEKIFEFENIKFYGKLDTGKKQGYKKVNIEAPFSDINFKDYSYLANSPESFKTSKNYYSRNELNDINDEYFGCQ